MQMGLFLRYMVTCLVVFSAFQSGLACFAHQAKRNKSIFG
jgi:hypothetical protein